jgi:hypothetical protein
MISWILFMQTPWNTVKFITNEDASYQVLNYYKFKDFLAQFKKTNLSDFNKSLDSFQTVFLDCTTGEWKVEKSEIKEASFDQMLKLNPGKEELEEEKKKTDPLLRKKNFLDNFFKGRKKQNTSGNLIGNKYKNIK